MAQCRARTAAGARCKANALRESQFCFAHAPEVAEARQAARIRGGHNRRRPVRLSGDTPITIASMADVLRLVNAIVLDSWEMDNSASRSRVLLACCETGIKTLQVGEFEARLLALEQAAGVRGNPSVMEQVNERPAGAP